MSAYIPQYKLSTGSFLAQGQLGNTAFTEHMCPVKISKFCYSNKKEKMAIERQLPNSATNF